ncbi:hypothetical protein DPMN_160014 [Dreissena polymorpha]|uniref:Uncharacterized protein n=1 Tax=Dreissena polymorpha TaxID=45954 RepID=A0A9D4IS66_DREPO|nr:hypothetical protein DPMN_160014 [Dreissena polymorpha]
MRPKTGPMPSTNPPASVKLLGTASVKLLASAKPLALRLPKALGEASVTALYDVRRLQPSEDPLTIQQELKSPGSTVRSQRKHPNASEHPFLQKLIRSHTQENSPLVVVLLWPSPQKDLLVGYGG